MLVVQLESVWYWVWEGIWQCLVVDVVYLWGFDGWCYFWLEYGRFFEEMLLEGGQYDYVVFVEDDIDFMQVYSCKIGSIFRVQLVVEFQKVVFNDVGQLVLCFWFLIVSLIMFQIIVKIFSVEEVDDVSCLLVGMSMCLVKVCGYGC